MNIIKKLEKDFIVLMAIAILLGGLSTKAYATEKKSVDMEKQKGDSRYSQQKRNKKKKNEYAKWKIKKVDGNYFYKQKAVRLLVDDTGKKTVKNKLYYNKKGIVDIRIMRNKKGRIKKIKYISKKRAKEIIENYNTTYYIPESVSLTSKQFCDDHMVSAFVACL